MVDTPVASVSVAITADDKTAKGVRAAEKRFDGLGKKAAKIGGDAARIGDRSGLKLFGRTLHDVDQAASRAFGTGSVLGGLPARLGAIKKIGSSIGTSFGRASVELGEAAAAGEAAGVGLGEAAAGAGALAIAMGPVAVVGAAAVAVLGAGAIAGYKFASGWAASTAQMGRFAETIGISAQALQQFQGAAARYGIGKDETNSSLAAFTQNVHDARYGRNNETLALMSRLGVKFRSKPDGTLDYTNMLGDTADALARQRDPQTALMIANHLGIAGMLPLLRKGRGTVAGEMGDVARHGVNLGDSSIADAQRFNRDAVIMGQMADRKKQGAQAWTAGKYAGAMDKGVELGRSALDGTIGAGAARAIGEGAATFGRSVVQDFVPAAKKIGEAVGRLLAAAGTTASEAVGGSPAFAEAIERRGERSRDDQVSPKGARSRMQVMPYTAHHPGFGIRPAANDSIDEYNRVGREYAAAMLRHYDGNWALASAAYNAGTKPVDRWIKNNGDPRKGEISDRDWIARIPGDGPHSYEETRRYAERVTEAQPMPVHVTVELVNAPPGTKAKVIAGRTNAPAVSHAMQH